MARRELILRLRPTTPIADTIKSVLILHVQALDQSFFPPLPQPLEIEQKIFGKHSPTLLKASFLCIKATKSCLEFALHDNSGAVEKRISCMFLEHVYSISALQTKTSQLNWSPLNCS